MTIETKILLTVLTYFVCGFIFLGYYINHRGKEKIELENIPMYIILWFLYLAMMLGGTIHTQRDARPKTLPFESLEGKPGWLEKVIANRPDTSIAPPVKDDDGACPEISKETLDEMRSRL